MENRKRTRKISINNRELLISANINFKDRDFSTPLHWAVESGHLEVVKLLLNKGANVKIKNNEDKTALDIARDISRRDIIKILENPLYVKPEIEIQSSSQLSTQQTDVNNSTKIQKKQRKQINAIHGNIYQLKMLMLFLYRGLSQQYSFRLGSEVKEAKKLDNLVFEYMNGDTKIYRLLQAKHRLDESKKITASELLTRIDGDYNLIKYFISYQDCKKKKLFRNGVIKDVTICTNIDFDLQNLKNSNITVQKIQNKDGILDFESNKNPSRYKFNENIVSLLKAKLENYNEVQQSITNHSYSDDEIKDFINHLVFAVNQPNEEELGNVVKDEISKEFDHITTENVYNKFFIKMLDWLQHSESKEFFSYEDGKKFFDEVRTGISIWFNVRDPLESFVGREDQLHNLHKLLRNDEEVVTSQIVSVTGLGGIGKSELVRKYINKYSHDYGNKIIWINAESFTTLGESFHKLARDYLGINTKNANGEEKCMISIVKDVYKFFSSGKSLFIFDNAHKYKSQEKFDCGIEEFLPSLPSDSYRPYIIITSRNCKWPTKIRVLQLNVFDEVEAKNLIMKSLDVKDDEKDIGKLAEQTQFLPLALQQAIAYIKMENESLINVGSQFKIDDYLKKYKEQKKDILNFNFSGDSDIEYTKTIFSTWNITLDTIKRRENGNDALKILNVLSYLVPENIPMEMLLYLVNDKTKLGAAIGLLKQYSMINSENTMVNIHRLVQHVTRIQLQEKNKEEKILIEALKLFEQSKINSITLDHAMSVWKHSSRYNKIVNEYSHIASHINVELIDSGRYEEAYLLGKEISELLRGISTDHPSILAIDQNIGGSLLMMGQYDAALETFQDIFEKQKNIFGANDPLNFVIKENIALALFKQGKYREALEYYRKVLDQKKTIFEDNHPEVLSAKCNIATTLIRQGKYDKSLRMLQEVCHIQQAVLGENHPDTMNTKNSIAGILCNQCKFDEALQIFQHICKVKETHLNKNHPEVLLTKKNIGCVLLSQAKYHEALSIFQEILNIEKMDLGKNHPNVLFTHMYIADILRSQGKYDKALQTYQKIANAQRDILGPDHPDTLNTLYNKAFTLDVVGKYDEALCLFEEILRKRKAFLGSEHPEVLKVINVMATINSKQRNYDKALRYYEDIIKIQLTQLGENHVDTLSTKNNIGMLFFQKKQYSQALEIFQDTYGKLQKVYNDNPNHPEMFAVKNNIGLVLGSEKRYDEAIKIFEEVRQSQELILGKEHYETAMTRSNTAKLLIWQKKLPEALEIFQEVLKVLKKVLEPDHPHILEVSQVTQSLLSLHSDFLKAAESNNYEKVKYCINEGANVNTKDSENRTLLHHAVYNGNLNMVNLLLKSGADVTQISNKGNTPLHIATFGGHEKIIEVLLSNVSSSKLKNFIDAKTTVNRTASLHVAAKNGYFNIVLLLLKHGANYNIKNKNGETPRKVSIDKNITNLFKTIDELFEGAKKGNIEIFDKLKASKPEEFAAITNTRNNEGNTLLQVAVVNKRKNIAMKLSELLKTSYKNT